MARALLSLYRVDRAALRALSDALRAELAEDDHAAVARRLGLGPSLAERLASRPAIDWLVRPDDDPEAAPLFASLRRVAKKGALEKVWTSEHPSLEGRLRAFEPLRDEPAAAAAIDRALDPAPVPFFLLRKGGTAGILGDADRAAIAAVLGASGSIRDDDLPPELAAFGDALEELDDGELLVHDALD